MSSQGVHLKEYDIPELQQNMHTDRKMPSPLAWQIDRLRYCRYFSQNGHTTSSRAPPAQQTQAQQVRMLKPSILTHALIQEHPLQTTCQNPLPHSASARTEFSKISSQKGLKPEDSTTKCRKLQIQRQNISRKNTRPKSVKTRPHSHSNEPQEPCL